jgi:hypothetical protein
MRLHVPLALGLLLLATTTSACETVGTPWLELRITASEYAGADRTFAIALHDNGCAAILRPAYFRSPGAYRLPLDAADRQRFAELASTPALRTFDAQAIRAGMAQRLSGNADQPAELFEVADAGRFELILHDLDGRRVLQFDGVPQYAERFPDIPELADFNAVVDAAHALATRQHLRPVPSSTAGEPQ